MAAKGARHSRSWSQLRTDGRRLLPLGHLALARRFAVVRASVHGLRHRFMCPNGSWEAETTVPREVVKNKAAHVTNSRKRKREVNDRC